MKAPSTGELARRDVALRRWIGRQLTDLRLEFGVTQLQLAECAGIDQGHLSKIETGAARPSLEALTALSACLGTDLSVRLFPTGAPRLHDRFQAPMIDALIQFLGPAWRAQPEVPVRGARGVIDLVVRRALDHLTIACECHSELRRLELVIRRAAEKAEALQAQANGGSVSSVLLLRSTRTTREVAKAFEATIVAAFPARSVDALTALSGRAAWPGPAVIWATVASGKAELMTAPPRGVRVGR